MEEEHTKTKNDIESFTKLIEAVKEVCSSAASVLSSAEGFSDPRRSNDRYYYIVPQEDFEALEASVKKWREL